MTSPIISSISNSGTITIPTGADTLVGRATIDTLTNKTLTAPKIASGGFIADANGNEQIIFTTTASAVNEITITNAATGNKPTIAATGGDTNVTLNLTSKGTGTVQANGVDVVTTSGAQTLTSKRITRRIATVSSSATPTLNTDNYDVAEILSLATDITNMSTNLSGTPTNEQTLMYKIKSASIQNITWGTSFMSSGTATLPTATVAGKIHRVFFIYDNTAGVQKWVCMAVDTGGY